MCMKDIKGKNVCDFFSFKGKLKLLELNCVLNCMKYLKENWSVKFTNVASE